MPKNRFQERIFDLITGTLTVPCFLVYCLSYESGGILNIDIKNSLIFLPIELYLHIYQKHSSVIIQIDIIATTVCFMCS